MDQTSQFPFRTWPTVREVFETGPRQLQRPSDLLRLAADWLDEHPDADVADLAFDQDLSEPLQARPARLCIYHSDPGTSRSEVIEHFAISTPSQGNAPLSALMDRVAEHLRRLSDQNVVDLVVRAAPVDGDTPTITVYLRPSPIAPSPEPRRGSATP